MRIFFPNYNTTYFLNNVQKSVGSQRDKTSITAKQKMTSDSAHGPSMCSNAMPTQMFGRDIASNGSYFAFLARDKKNDFALTGATKKLVRTGIHIHMHSCRMYCILIELY